MLNNVEDKLEGVPVQTGCAAANTGTVVRLGHTVELVARAIVAVLPLAKVKMLTMAVPTNEHMILNSLKGIRYNIKCCVFKISCNFKIK